MLNQYNKELDEYDKVEFHEKKEITLLTVDELRLLFKLNNIETTLTDVELEQLIQIEQKSICAELGISLDPIKHTFTYYPNYTEPRKQARVPITLPLVNVISIDKITINGHYLAQAEDYFFDDFNSILYLIPRHRHRRWYWAWPWFWNITLIVKIDYTTQITDASILDLLKSLLGDVLVYHQTPSMNKDVTSIKEGDVTVSFDRDTEKTYTLPQIIDNKKESLLSLLNNTRVMMI